jgi:hypothetical protein
MPSVIHFLPLPKVSTPLKIAPPAGDQTFNTWAYKDISYSNHSNLSYALNPLTNLNYCLKHSHEARMKGTMKITIIVIRSTSSINKLSSPFLFMPFLSENNYFFIAISKLFIISKIREFLCLYKGRKTA